MTEKLMAEETMTAAGGAMAEETMTAAGELMAENPMTAAERSMAEETMTAAEETAAERLGTAMDAAVRLLIGRNISISTMESCTSGLLASEITDTEGASAVFKGAFVTYSNEAKVMQGVPEELITAYGVYSLPVAEAMAEACRRAYGAQIGIGVTGTMENPDPNNADSVPGEICCAILWNERKCLHKLHPDTAGMPRHEIKKSITAEIARLLLRMLSS